MQFAGTDETYDSTWFAYKSMAFLVDRDKPDLLTEKWKCRQIVSDVVGQGKDSAQWNKQYIPQFCRKKKQCLSTTQQ